MLHTEKPTTLKDSYSCKITLFCCFYPSILYSHLPPAPPWQTAKTHQNKIRTQITACWSTSPPSGKWESEHEGKGWGQREQGEPAAGGLQMWWLWGQATLARFRPPILTLFFPLLHLLSQWQEPSGLAERVETQHRPTLPSVAPACHSAESTSK